MLLTRPPPDWIGSAFGGTCSIISLFAWGYLVMWHCNQSAACSSLEVDGGGLQKPVSEAGE